MHRLKTSDVNLNSLLRACLTIDHHQRPTVEQLLRSAFIAEGPRRNDVLAINSSSRVGISGFLKNMQAEALSCANSIVDANADLWLAEVLITAASPDQPESPDDVGHRAQHPGDDLSFDLRCSQMQHSSPLI